MKKTISPDEVREAIKSLKKTSVEITEGIKSANFSAKGRARILLKLDELEVQAYKCKISVSIDEMAETTPPIPYKEVLSNILKMLPDSMSAKAVMELLDFTTEVWTEKTALVEAD